MKLVKTSFLSFFLLLSCLSVADAMGASESSRKAFNFNKQETVKKRSAVRRQRSRFAGRWRGTLYQPDGTLRPKFAFTMRFYQKGARISGFSRISLQDSPQYFGVMSLKGTARKNRLSFTETKITRQNVAPDAFWCIKSGNLKLSYPQGKPVLKGNWRAPENCPSGTIVLKKVK
jgi:hypothetical protein